MAWEVAGFGCAGPGRKGLAQTDCRPAGQAVHVLCELPTLIAVGHGIYVAPLPPAGLPVSTCGIDLNCAVRARFVPRLGANLSFVSHTRPCVFNNILGSIVLKYIYFAAPLHLITWREYRRADSRRRARDSLSAAELDNNYRLSQPKRLVKRKTLLPWRRSGAAVILRSPSTDGRGRITAVP
jgi:hypothetical protein